MAPLGMMLTAYQQKYDVDARGLAKRIGISESTLCRVKQGKMPDAEGLALIIAWMVKA